MATQGNRAQESSHSTWDSAMNETTFTSRVDGGLKSQFSTAAKSRYRTAAQLLRDFMRDFVKQQQGAAAHDAWFRRQVQVGLDAANAGDVVSSEAVEAEAACRCALKAHPTRSSG